MTTLNVPIQIRRGTAAAMPATLLAGELYYQTDTGNLYIGIGTGVAKISGGAAWGAITGTLSNQIDLQTALTSEATSRANADTTLQNNINAETTRAQGAEGTNATAISTETTRAQAAEALLLPLAGGSLSGALTVINNTPATSLVSQSSPIVTLTGEYWTGSVSAADSWTLQVVETNGTNGASKLTIGHSGSSGALSLVLPTAALTWSGTSTLTFNLAAAVFNLGNGQSFTIGQQGQGALNLTNQAAATSGASQPSAKLSLNGAYWTGAASATDSFVLQDVIANGTNGASSLVITHTGSSGFVSITLPDSGAAPTSAGTAGTAGQIAYHAGVLYFCSVTGAAGSAMWNKLNMTAV